MILWVAYITLISIKPLNLDRVLIVSVYRPPKVKFEAQYWKIMFQKILSIDSFGSIIIAGDFNAQYSGWGSIRNNYAGISLRDYLEQSHFIILNDGCRTRVSANANYVSCPDITLVKSGIWNFTWSVKDDPLGSDHLPIDINFFNSKEPNPGTDLNLNRTRLFLNHFYKKLFTTLVAKHMLSILFDVEAVQQYEK